MPKTEVRQAIFDYLQPSSSNITYLGTLYSALPKVGNEADLYNLQPPGQGVGGIIFMHIEDQQERMIDFAGKAKGPSQKLREYTLVLLCIFKSDLPGPDAGQAAFDTFIDSLTGWIEADVRAGSDVVFQWGLGDSQTYGPDLRFTFPVPTTDAGGVTLFQGIGRVQVSEYLNNLT